jgi:hypothetical protein
MSLGELLYFYYILTLVILSFTLLSYFQRKLATVFAIISTLIMAIFSALKWERGTDWIPYLEIHENVDYFIQSTSIEYGFLYYIKTLNYISTDFSFYMIVTSGIIYLILFMSLRKLSVDLNLSIFCLWCLHISIFFWVRQTIAVAFVFYSLIYLLKGNNLKFITCIIIASFFHFSALIFLFVWFLRTDFTKRTTVHLTLLLATVITICNLLIPESILGKYLYYIDGEYDDSLKLEGFTIGFWNAFFSISNRMALILLFFISVDRSSLVNNLMLRIYFCGLPIHLISELTFSIFGRLLIYFDIAALVLIPAVIHSKSDVRLKGIIYLIIFFPYLIIRYYRAMNGWYVDLFIPYKWIFDKSLPVILF